jgi:hypothetical protein
MNDEEKMTMYLLSHTHRGVDCSGKDPELMKQLAAKSSNDNLAKRNVNLLTLTTKSRVQIPVPALILSALANILWNPTKAKFRLTGELESTNFNNW